MSDLFTKAIRKKYVLVLLVVLALQNSTLAQDDLQISKFMEPVNQEHIFRTEGYYNWGGSIVKGTDGMYHLFYSRWPKSVGFKGWLVYSEIAHATSEKPTGPWTFRETVLQGNGKGHWDAITAHNPKIKFFEGKYYLYYISTNLGTTQDYTAEELDAASSATLQDPLRFALRSNQRTGVAVSNSLNGPWQRQSQPLIQPSGPITTLTVNPAVTQGKDGLYYMIVKGDKPGETRFIRNQAIAISQHPDGPYEIQPDPVIDYLDTEDMSLWYDQQRELYYGIFHAPEGFIGLVSSVDGLKWLKASEYRVMPKEIKMQDGTILRPDRLERPFVYEEKGNLLTLGVSAKQGDDSFVIFHPLRDE
ncbi:glycoside hydrolase family protein [Algoriphagus halophytocola]|uniref:glycoside hydrolase family protein n=1 Tax=Algoriphagus halophytocola TaxID=2991499 RepID=UPI0022DD87D6|nr:glycoside hydrolase family protein [Algoriphagus sp. TR-M9]WBL41762.1 glycoside hydrolase family protein [Algoriphagus sp. TR-M9]